MATFYGTLEKLDAYWLARTNPTTWTSASAADKLQGALAASEYIDRKYGFRGYPSVAGQERQWPRSGAYDDHGRRIEGVPVVVENAVAILAHEWIQGERFLTKIEAGATVGEVEAESFQVGPIRESVDYVPGSGGGSTFTRFPQVDADFARAGLLESGTRLERG